MQIFLDSDGVLADFDAFASSVLGMTLNQYEAAKHQPEGWDILYAVEDFFFKLPKMRDADELVQGVRDRGFEPIILTGVPSKDGSDWAIPQKERWYEKHYPGTRVICCKSKDKVLHQVAGKHNVLIDDWKRHMKTWQNAGGTFILHKNAKQSLAELDQVIEEQERESYRGYLQDKDNRNADAATA